MSIISLSEQVAYGTSRRFNCPECGGHNTLSITKLKGSIRYNCFKASCGIAGTRTVQMTHKEALNVLALRKPLQDRRAEGRHFAIPEYWIQGLASKKCFQMLLNHNALEAYRLGLFKVAYDPKLDRLVYLIQNSNGSLAGGVGRSLSGQLPKTFNYPNSEQIPFTCGYGNTAVLVEDCASACSIGRFKDYTGIALLGTTLRIEYLLYIVNKFSRVIIALDNDATYKSLKLRKTIEAYVKDTHIWTLRKDLKNMTHTEVFEYINNPKKQIYIDN